MKKIKWIALQPLTGGMYIGFANALGCDAECIISFKGLNDGKQCEGKRSRCGNEYNLTCYLEKHNRHIPRYEFVNQGMFDNVDNPELDGTPDFNDTDIVCAVPVCSGLSMLTTTDSAAKEQKNCNMKFLAKYALKKICPKVYVFENAPGFMSEKNVDLRKWFEQLAYDCRYSVTYFSTDTKLHHNCQHRPRTFVVFTKWSNGPQRAIKTPLWESVQYNITDVLSKIPADATYQNSLPAPMYDNDVYIEYIKEKFGVNWKKYFAGDVMNTIIKLQLVTNFRDWCMTTDKVPRVFGDRMMRHIDKVITCLSEHRGWWSSTPRYYPTLAPAVQSRTVLSTIHPTEDRLCSERDMLTLMGMPYDFEMQCDFMNGCRQIGQNVPVKTAEWIANVCLYIIEHINDPREDGCKARYYDNTKQKIVC
jgi:site-specific DNA-cytosine methylase